MYKLHNCRLSVPNVQTTVTVECQCIMYKLQ